MLTASVRRMPDTVLLRRDGAAATVVLNRPDSLNAWNRDLGADLLAALREAAADDGVRAVRITGAGRAFSAGADLKDIRSDDMQTAEGGPDIERMLTERYHPIITLLREVEKPVIAAVNGPAAGIGASLAFASDLILARESAYFLLAFVNIGLVPDGGSSLLVPSRVGFTRAMEMAMLGERVAAPQALAWGLVNRVAADDAFEAESDALLERLAAGPTRAYAGIKRQLNHWLYARMAEQLEVEAAIQQRMATSGDFAEGVAAFVERRQAMFGGR
jgi:2-(1,2-epoxy-1,2-dihydrophenyl)acetyl-CoA isomerase